MARWSRREIEPGSQDDFQKGSHIERFAKGILGLRDEPRRDGAQHSWREGSRENPISVPHAVGKRC